jgi:hypothetical protein
VQGLSVCLDCWCAHLHVRVEGLCGFCVTSHVTNSLQDCGPGRSKCPHGKQAYHCQVFAYPFVAVARVCVIELFSARVCVIELFSA